MLRRVQQGLESLYRIETELAVDDFLVDDRQRRGLGLERCPREQLLVSEDETGVFVGLYVDADIVAALGQHSIPDVLDQHLGDLLMIVEGVSHFVYTVHAARTERSVCALELELQGEIDKYVTCLFAGAETQNRSQALRGRLFQDCVFDDDLSEEETIRYRRANENALRYCEFLERRFVVPRRLGAMIGELRTFYRKSLAAKLDHIGQAA